MEVEQVEARATELMETEDMCDEPSIEMKMYEDAPSTQKGEMEDLECDDKYKIVRDFNLESDVGIFIPEQSKLKNGSGGSFISNFQSKSSSKPEPKQIVSLWKSKKNGGKKRKFEGTDLAVDCGRNEAKRQCGSC